MRRIIGFSLFIASLLIVSQSNAAPADLFIPLPELSSTDRLSKKAAPGDFSAKEKQVGVNTSALASIPDSLNIDLFGKTVIAVLDRTERVSGDSITWIGHIENIDNQVILVISGSLVQGTIAYHDQTYQIRYTGTLNSATLHVLRLTDTSKLLDEHPPGFIENLKKDSILKKNRIPNKAQKDQKNFNSADAAADSGAFVDVMVVWTPAARQGAGGAAAISALIDLAFSETNQSYANSGIKHRLRLAHKQEVAYTESDSIFTDKDHLDIPDDGYLDNIYTLRDTYKADLVSLFISIPGIYCGVADTPLSGFYDQAAFSVINYECAVDNRSFAHETGHNFSALHDWRTDSDTTLPYIYPYSHGHLHDGSDSWRTIMSYRKCTGSGPCTRLNNWSNPDKLYNGVAMGVPEGSAQAADNRKTLNNAAPFIANYRVSGTYGSAQFTSWDIDGNTKADALTDGLLVLRYLFKFNGDSLINNAIAADAKRKTATDIKAYLQKGVDNGALDIDGNGKVDALTDGLLVLRYLFGFTGDSLVNNAIADDATRRNANDVEAYLQSKMP